MKKAKPNDKLVQQFGKHWEEIAQRYDKEYIGTVFLYMTYNYDDNQEFMDQFDKFYTRISGAIVRTTKKNRLFSIDADPKFERIYHAQQG